MTNNNRFFEDTMQGLLEAIELDKARKQKMADTAEDFGFTEEDLKKIDKELNITPRIGVCFWENWERGAINEIDDYISKINSHDRFIEKVNSIEWHEDENFYIPEEYKDMSLEEIEKKKQQLYRIIKGEEQYGRTGN